MKRIGITYRACPRKELQMPSETFFRLSETKQERIIEAIKEEIANSPYENFSIGTVIRQCGISRGSFYQYFSNKEDIYTFLIHGYQQQVFRHMKETLQSNGGDFFEMVEKTYRFAVRMLCYKDSRAFRHNLFCNMRLFEMLWEKSGYAEESLQNVSMLHEYINKDKLRVNSDEEMAMLFDICMITALKDAAGIFMAGDNEQATLNAFLNKLALLKRAFEKTPEELITHTLPTE